LVFVALGVFYSAIFSPLNSMDDPGMYQYLLNAEDFTVGQIFIPGGGNYYRPLLLVSYLADKYIWGLEESFMHLENIVFHLFNTLLLFAVVRKAASLQGIRSTLLPLTAALLFALHPLNTESVNWIAGRTDLLAAFFLLLSVWLLLWRSNHWLRPTLAALCMLLACLAKETAIFLLPAALLFPLFLPVCNSDRNGIFTRLRRDWFSSLVFLLAGLGYFSFRTFAFNRGDAGASHVVAHVVGDQSAGLLFNLNIVLRTAGFYLKKLFVPFPLNFAIIQVSDLYLPVGVMAFLIVAWAFRSRTMPAFFVVCAAAAGSSALMIPLLKATWTPLAERYMYIPSAFFIAGLTMTFYHWQTNINRRNLVTILAATVIVVFACGTASRNLLWQDNLALFQDTLRKSPEFEPAKGEIARALLARGRTQEAMAIAKTIRSPEDLNTAQLIWVTKASYFAQNEEWSSARIYLEKALANPGDHEKEIRKGFIAFYDYQIMALRGDMVLSLYAEIIPHMQRIYELTADPFYQYRLGQSYLFLQQRQNAQKAFNLAAAQAPLTAHYRQAALELARTLAE
jgi:tetratricopeptide (TPR) repeat protein